MSAAGPTAWDTYAFIIWDCDPGSIHLVIDPSGIIGIHADALQRISFAARFVHAGAPPRIDDQRSFVSREEKRVAAILRSADAASVGRQSMLWVDDQSVERISAGRRVASSFIEWTRRTAAGSMIERYSWTPSVNDAKWIAAQLTDIYGRRFAK